MNKGHPVFWPEKVSPPQVHHNTLFDMIKAAQSFGWDAFWNAPRLEQAAMTAFIPMQQALQLMTQYDMTPRTE